MITFVLIGVFGGTLLVTMLFLGVVHVRHRNELATAMQSTTDTDREVVMLITSVRAAFFSSRAFYATRRITRALSTAILYAVRAGMSHIAKYIRPLWQKAANQFRPTYRTSAHNGRSASVYLKDISEHKRKISNGVQSPTEHERSDVENTSG